MSLRLHLFPAAALAEEMALRDAELLRKIKPGEIRNGAWMNDAVLAITVAQYLLLVVPVVAIA